MYCCATVSVSNEVNLFVTFHYVIRKCIYLVCISQNYSVITHISQVTFRFRGPQCHDSTGRSRYLHTDCPTFQYAPLDGRCSRRGGFYRFSREIDFEWSQSDTNPSPPSHWEDEPATVWTFGTGEIFVQRPVSNGQSGVKRSPQTLWAHDCTTDGQRDRFLCCQWGAMEQHPLYNLSLSRCQLVNGLCTGRYRYLDCFVNFQYNWLEDDRDISNALCKVQKRLNYLIVMYSMHICTILYLCYGKVFNYPPVFVYSLNLIQ